MTAAGRAPALCCLCGNVRTVSTGYYAGTSRVSQAEAVWSEERLAEIQSRGHLLEQEVGWRCLTILKCDNCGERTRHARIRDDEGRNMAEETDRLRDARRQEPLRP